MDGGQIPLHIPPGSHSSLLLWSSSNFQRVTNLILKGCDSNECCGCVVQGCRIKWAHLQYQQTQANLSNIQPDVELQCLSLKSCQLNTKRHSRTRGWGGVCVREKESEMLHQKLRLEPRPNISMGHILGLAVKHQLLPRVFCSSFLGQFERMHLSAASCSKLWS